MKFISQIWAIEERENGYIQKPMPCLPAVGIIAVIDLLILAANFLNACDISLV
jgi:hypothetical protein